MPEATTAHIRIQEIIHQLEEQKNNLSEEHWPMVNELQKLAAEHKNEIAVANAILFSGILNQNTGSIKEAVELYKQGYRLFEKLKLSKKITVILNLMGWCIGYLQGNYEEGLEYLHHAKISAETTGDKIGIAASLQNIGVIHSTKGNDPLALEHFLKSLNIWKKSEKNGGCPIHYKILEEFITDRVIIRWHWSII